MKYKKPIILMALTVFILLSIASVCAGDIDENPLANQASDDANDFVSADDSDLNLANSNEEILKTAPKSFSDLNSTINDGSDSDVYLEDNYTYNTDTDAAFVEGIVIDRPLNVYGNGVTIDGANSARIFDVISSNVKFYNITFVNANSRTIEVHGYGGAFRGNGDTAAINCIFINNRAEDDGGAIYKGDAYNCVFINNYAGLRGGAMYKSNYIVNSTFIYNFATLSDYFAVGEATNIINSTFIYNSEDAFVGASYENAIKCNFIKTAHQGTSSLDCTSSDTGTLSASDFITSYGSGERFMFTLENGEGIQLDGVHTNVTIKNSTFEKSFFALTGEGFVVDLPPGVYEVTLSYYLSERIIPSLTKKLTVTDGTTFSDLNKIINGNAADEITLDKDYTFNSTVDSDFYEGILIDRQLTINGNNHTLDGLNTARIFQITAASVNLSNITFKNGYGGNGGALLFKSDLINSNINANFNNNNASLIGGAIYFTKSLTNVNITGNFTKNNANGHSLNMEGGGAICFYGELNHVNIIGNFTDNIAYDNAGANSFKSKITNVNIFGNYNNNTATGQNGGANWFVALENVTITGNYSNNKANTGGANFFYEALENVNITGNYINNTAISGNGGANQFMEGLKNVAITGDYSCNKAKNGGANFFVDGGLLNNVNITGNYCHNEAREDGGANRLGNPVLVNIIGNYTNNTAKNTLSWNGGGAIFVMNSPNELKIAANFYNNTAVSQGAAICFYNKMNNVDVTGNLINNNGKSVIYNYGASNSIIHDSIFINNSKINVGGSGTIKIVDTWFGNNATNYDIAPDEQKIDFENWLFLNATASPNTIPVSGSSDITFKLYAYNKDTGITSDYDNSLLKPINLTVTSTNGVVDKEIIRLGDTVKYTATSMGTGTVTAHATVNCLGETTVLDENANTLLTINKADSSLAVNNIEFVYGSSGSTALSYSGASGVSAYVINQPNAIVDVTYNRITVSNLNAGQYTLMVTTIPYESYNAVSQTARITVNKADCDLSVDDIIMDYGKSVNVTVTTNGSTGITAKIDNQTVNATNYTIPISGLDAGLYTLTVTTVADANHNPVTKEANITVNKVDSIITLNDVELDYGSSINVTVTSEGALGITALIDNQTVEVNNFTIPISGLNVGLHELTVTSVADANHNPVNKTVTVTVNKLNTELTAVEITSTYNVNKNLVITLKDINGVPLSGENITVDLNGEKTFTTDGNGQVNVSTGSLAPKTYTAKIVFNGTENYASSAKEVNVTVKKATPKITAKAKTFKTTTKTKKYTITLKDNVGKVIKNAKVTLKVKGVTYKATTNSKGKATFKITKLTKKGTYKATVTYKGNSYYSKATKKVKITVKTAFKTVSKDSKDTKTVKKIQRALKNNGYYIKENSKTLKVDGIYDQYTVKAVKQFQKDKSLKVTGKVDEKTAKKLKII